jgi:hypothetical protein
MEITCEYLLGPVRWSNSIYGRIMLLCHVLNFSYITLYPLFLPPQNQPFGSPIAQLAAAGAMVFVSTPFAQVYILPTTRRMHPGVPLLDIDTYHHIIGLNIMYALRFTDCWTGARLRTVGTQRCR